MAKFAKDIRPLNPDPIGPAHIYWPNGAPTSRAPKKGIYAIGYNNERLYEFGEFFSQRMG